MTADYLQQSSDLVTEKSTTISLTFTAQEEVQKAKTSEKSADTESLKIVQTMQALEELTNSCMLSSEEDDPVITITTDENGNTIETDTYANGDSEQVVTNKDGTSVTTTTTHEGVSNDTTQVVVTEKDAEGKTTSTTTTSTTTNQTFDSDGNSIGSTTTVTLTDSTGTTQTTVTTKDQNGNKTSTCVTTTVKNGTTTVETTAADGSTTVTSTDKNGNETKTTTDTNGNVTVITKGKTTTTTDKDGNTVTTQTVTVATTDKYGDTTTTETTTTTEKDKASGNTTVTTETKTTDIAGSITDTVTTTTTDKNGNIVDSSTETTDASKYGFTTSSGQRHVMGGNSIGVAIASLNEAQDTLLQVSLDWLQQNRLTFQAGTQLSLSEFNDMKTSAHDQKTSSQYEAYQMFAQGAASGAGIGVTLGQTRSARDNIRIQGAHADHQQETLNLLNRTETPKVNVMEAGSDLQKTRKSDVQKISDKVTIGLVKQQPKEGETTVHHDISKALDDEGFEAGDLGKKYITDDNGFLKVDGSDELITVAATLPETRTADGTRIRQTGDKEFIDDDGYVVTGANDTTRKRNLGWRTYKSTSAHINTNGSSKSYNVDTKGFKRTSTGERIAADGSKLDAADEHGQQVTIAPNGEISDNGVVIGRARFVTREEVIAGEPLRNGTSGDPITRFVTRDKEPNDLDYIPEDHENTLGNRQTNFARETFGADPTIVKRQTGLTRYSNPIRSFGKYMGLDSARVLDAPNTNRPLNFKNKRLEGAVSRMDASERVAFKKETQERLQKASKERSDALMEFNNALQFNRALFDALGNFAGGSCKMISADYGYDAQVGAANSKFEGNMANQFFSSASNWQGQASKAYDQSLSTLSGPLDALRRAVSRG